LLAACFTLHSINATLAIVPQRGAGLWIIPQESRWLFHFPLVLYYFLCFFAGFCLSVFFTDEVLPLSTNVTSGHIFHIHFNFASVINLEHIGIAKGKRQRSFTVPSAGLLFKFTIRKGEVLGFEFLTAVIRNISIFWDITT
jgi:hypothetical protein